MANKRTRAVNKEEVEKIISSIRTGFVLPGGDRVRPNERVATALTLQANLGLRIGDVVHLRLADILFKVQNFHRTSRGLYLLTGLRFEKWAKTYSKVIPAYSQSSPAPSAKGVQVLRYNWCQHPFIPKVLCSQHLYGK